MLARQVDLLTARIHGHQRSQPHLALAGLHLADADGVAVGGEAHVVQDPHRRHDEAVLARQRAAKGADLVGQLAAVQVVDQGQQAVAKLDLDVVDGQGGGDRLFLGLGGLGLGFRLGRRLGLLGASPGQGAGGQRDHRERQDRHPRHQGDDAGGGRDHAEARGIGGQLGDQGLVGRALDAGLGDQEAGGDRDDQGGHLADQAIADGHHRVVGRRLAHRQVVLDHADDQAADDVDAGDDQAGHGVAAHKLGGAVHGAEEGRFLLQLLAPLAGLVLVDQPRRQIGVDGHLLAGHGVQGEAGGHLGDATRTLGDHHEVHDHQDGEDDDADDEVALHHQLAEGLDDPAGGLGALVPMPQDQANRGDVQAQAEQGGHQQHRREGGELQRLLDHQRGHQDQHRAGDRQGQQQV